MNQFENRIQILILFAKELIYPTNYIQNKNSRPLKRPATSMKSNA